MEQTGVLLESADLCPDIIVRHPGGVPVAVETEFAPAHTVENDACERLGKTLKEDGRTIEQAIAVRIPKYLSTVNQSELLSQIADANLAFCIWSSGPDAPHRWPTADWIEGDVDDLANCIEQAALSEDRIAQGMQVLEDGIGQAATILRDTCAPETLKTIAEELHQGDGQQTSRMAMAIVANALMFHMTIAGAHAIATLNQIRGDSGNLSKDKVLNAWQHILTKINYWPIFRIASDILLPIRNGTARQILERLARVASELDALGATSQHDLCGRMFQRLIADRKLLATFYTLPSSAALLAELAVFRLDTDWSDEEAITSLRVADFACGTGALLNATYTAIMNRYRRTGGDDQALHSRMMERALVGADIMPAAVHLTATVLSSTHPSLLFEDTSIITLAYGEQPREDGQPVIALGSLDLIGEEKTLPLFETRQKRIRGIKGGHDKRLELPHGSFDLVIMNPPFTRPTGQEADKIGIPVPAFAGFATGQEEQKAMSKRLKKIRKPGMAGHGNAGLASNFMDIAHAKVKLGGVLALVLPASFLQGEAWKAARILFNTHYRDIMVVSIAAAGATDRAFSADTGMAEVLIIAIRKVPDDVVASTAFINLHRRPKTILEAMTLARTIQRTPTDLFSTPVRIGVSEEVGCCIQGNLSDAGCAGIREAGIAQTAAGLLKGELWLPRRDVPIPLPVTSLGNLGDRGLYHMDIAGTETVGSGLPRGPFDIELPGEGVATWPVLWGHDAVRETRLVVEPDRRGRIRRECEQRATQTWNATASHLHFNRDFQLKSQPLAACMTLEPTIGGRAWPNFLCTKAPWEIPMVLWANSTLGLLAFWWAGTRQQLGRVSLSISKLPALVTLDVRQLSTRQIDQSGIIFRQFKDRKLLPANEAWRDETRHDLDQAMLIELLGLSKDILESLALLRRQWCAEPSVHGGKKLGQSLGEF